MQIDLIVLLLAILFTGMMAGIFFTWSNAVSPGIGRLADRDYLSALQSMNRVILNLPFFTLFWGAIALGPIVIYFMSGAASVLVLILLLLATIIYWAGAFLMTLLGNVPLNHLVEREELSKLHPGELRELRRSVEQRWNQYNLIRTLSSMASFILLLLSGALYLS